MKRVEQRRLGVEVWRGFVAKFADSGLTALRLDLGAGVTLHLVRG